MHRQTDAQSSTCFGGTPSGAHLPKPMGTPILSQTPAPITAPLPALCNIPGHGDQGASDHPPEEMSACLGTPRPPWGLLQVPLPVILGLPKPHRDPVSNAAPVAAR